MLTGPKYIWFYYEVNHKIILHTERRNKFYNNDQKPTKYNIPVQSKRPWILLLSAASTSSFLCSDRWLHPIRLTTCLCSHCRWFDFLYLKSLIAQSRPLGIFSFSHPWLPLGLSRSKTVYCALNITHIFSEADPDKDLQNVMFYIFWTLRKKSQMARVQMSKVEKHIFKTVLLDTIKIVCDGLLIHGCGCTWRWQLKLPCW